MKITINIDGNSIKKVFLSKWIIVVFLLGISILVFANTITKPNTFVAGTQIVASEVNTNFDLLYDKVNELVLEISNLKSILSNVSRTNNNVYFDGVNLHVRNGLNNTQTTNSTGNIVIGYNESSTSTNGSHNLVVGRGNNYSSYGGIVVGYYNTISGQYSTVSAGRYNRATGYYSSVSGGQGNSATYNDASVSGGYTNTASGSASSILGGAANQATDNYATVCGGNKNKAIGQLSTILGGRSNTANVSGYYSTILGGSGNTASSTDQIVP